MDGIDAVALASHYYSVESFQPRTPEEPFDRFPGGCYFDPDDGRFGGTPHEHAFCPSHGDVRRYFEAVVGTLADYDVDAVEPESVGYPSALHPHDTTFGHAKRHVLATATEEWLLSQCFCEACRERAAGAGVDVAAARSVVRSLLRESLDAPGAAPPSLAALVREHPALEGLLRFRASVTGDLLEGLADAAGDTALDCYLMDGFGVDPGDGWPAGVRLDQIQRHCDRATVLCYVDDPAVAREAASGDVCVYHHTLAADAQLGWIERAVGRD